MSDYFEIEGDVIEEEDEIVLRGYEPMIVEACGCSPQEVAEVEELMRLQTGGTLDALRPKDFDRVAVVAYGAYQMLKNTKEVT